MGGKQGFQEMWVVLHYFYGQLLLINHVSSVNWDVWPKVKFSANWRELGLIRAE